MKRTCMFIILVVLALVLFSCAGIPAESTKTVESPESVEPVVPWSITQIYRDDFHTVYEIAPTKGGNYNIYGFLRVPEVVNLKHLLVRIQKFGKEQLYKDTVDQVRERALKGDRVTDRLYAVSLFISLPETNMNDGNRHLELDTVTLLEGGKYGHIDSQVCSLIDDAVLFVNNRLGIDLPKEVDMYGYSGEGNFIVRFALLHPQYIHAVCAGGISWSPSVALETLKGEALNYPLGLGEIEKYSNDFNLEQWQKIHFFIDNGLLDDRGSYNKKQLKSMKWSRNLSFPEIYDVFCDAFVSLTDNAQMVLYRTLGHERNSDDQIKFLKMNDGDEFVTIETSTPARVMTSAGTVVY